MSRKFITDTILQTSEMTRVDADRIAASIVDAMRTEIATKGSFAIPDFGTFALRETPKRMARKPLTNEPVAVKAGVAVGFRASTRLKELAMAEKKKSKRRARVAA